MLAYVNDVLTPHGFDEIVKDDFAALRPDVTALDHVRSISTNYLGRRTGSPLSHSDPKRDGFTDQLQYRTQSEGSDYTI
jgi:hypothetical protein